MEALVRSARPESGPVGVPLEIQGGGVGEVKVAAANEAGVAGQVQPATDPAAGPATGVHRAQVVDRVGRLVRVLEEVAVGAGVRRADLVTVDELDEVVSLNAAVSA